MLMTAETAETVSGRRRMETVMTMTWDTIGQSGSHSKANIVRKILAGKDMSPSLNY